MEVYTNLIKELHPAYHHLDSCQETVPEAITAFLEDKSFEDVTVSSGGDCNTLTANAEENSYIEGKKGITMERLAPIIGKKVSQHVFMLVDVSDNLRGHKMDYLNQQIEEFVMELAENESFIHIQRYLHVLRFSTGAAWVTKKPVPAEEFLWHEIMPEGKDSDIGTAFDLLTARLMTMSREELGNPPAIVLFSGSTPTDNWRKPLANLMRLTPARYAFRAAVEVDVSGANREMLFQFTGYLESVTREARPLIEMMDVKLYTWWDIPIDEENDPWYREWGVEAMRFCEKDGHDFDGDTLCCKLCGMKLNWDGSIRHVLDSYFDGTAYVWKTDMRQSDICSISISTGNRTILTMKCDRNILTVCNALDGSRDGWMRFPKKMFEPEEFWMEEREWNALIEYLQGVDFENWKTQDNFVENEVFGACGFCAHEKFTCEFRNGRKFTCLYPENREFDELVQWLRKLVDEKRRKGISDIW